jgi:hypothetical protein
VFHRAPTVSSPRGGASQCWPPHPLHYKTVRKQQGVSSGLLDSKHLTGPLMFSAGLATPRWTSHESRGLPHPRLWL